MGVELRNTVPVTQFRTKNSLTKADKTKYDRTKAVTGMRFKCFIVYATAKNFNEISL